MDGNTLVRYLIGLGFEEVPSPSKVYRKLQYGDDTFWVDDQCRFRKGRTLKDSVNWAHTIAWENVNRVMSQLNQDPIRMALAV